MNKYERIEQIEDAIQMIEKAQDLVDEALSGTSIKGNYEAYGKYGFSQLLGNGNPYDGNLNKLMESLENEEVFD